MNKMQRSFFKALQDLMYEATVADLPDLSPEEIEEAALRAVAGFSIRHNFAEGCEEFGSRARDLYWEERSR